MRNSHETTVSHDSPRWSVYPNLSLWGLKSLGYSDLIGWIVPHSSSVSVVDIVGFIYAADHSVLFLQFALHKNSVLLHCVYKLIMH